MSMCLKNITKTSFNLLSKNAFQQLTFTATRQLFTPVSLGINGYLNARGYVQNQFRNVDHLFYNKMKDFTENPDSMIFTEDLKTMLHLVEKKPDHLELMTKMLVKYNSQNNLKFGSYKFGTVAMRALYHVDEPDLALKLFKDPELQNFFDQISSHQILMDLLYNHERYADVREVYEMTKNVIISGIVHPKNTIILVMAACYQENTKESYDYALELLKELQKRGYDFPRRSITFMAALALNQNDPKTALEITSLARNPRYIDIRCIKLESYALLERFNDILIYFRNSLQEDNPAKSKQLYFKDTFDLVESILLKQNFDEHSEIMQLLERVKIHDLVQPRLLREHITSPIHHIKQAPRENSQNNSYNFRTSYQNPYSDRFISQNNFEGDSDDKRRGLKNV